MKKFNGTQGPWQVNELGPHWNNNSLNHLEVTFGDDGECVCDTVYQREDANLIAAAPDLLRALQESLPIWENMKLHVSEASVLLDCRAAIAKALGEK